MTLAKILGPNGEVWATAPDDSWFHRDEPWPAVGDLVEACWAGRAQQGTAGQFGYGRVRLKWTDGHMSEWVNERGDDLLFSPDFWRTAPQESEKLPE